MPHTLLDAMACEAGRAMARVYGKVLQREVPLYGLMQLVRICGDALSGLDTQRAQLGPPRLLLTTCDGDSPQDGYAELELECQRRQGVINDLEKLIVKQDELLKRVLNIRIYDQNDAAIAGIKEDIRKVLENPKP